jgi:hypothetical protein
MGETLGFQNVQKVNFKNLQDWDCGCEMDGIADRDSNRQINQQNNQQNRAS